MPPQIFRPDPDWQRKADAVKFLAHDRCQACGSGPPLYVLEAHHNTYAHRGRELPHELLCLCARCHRHFEYIRTNHYEITRQLQTLEGRKNGLRVPMEHVHAYYELELRDLASRVDDLERDLDELLGLSDGQRALDEMRGREAA